MPGGLLTKHGVSFAVIAPAGFRILSALETVARSLNYDLMITSACDGEHSGPNDPHGRGLAFDLRLKPLSPTMKDDVHRMVLLELSDHAEPLQVVSTGLATELFYAQIEDRGGENEHLHVQLRNGRQYPPLKTFVNQPKLA